LVEVTGVPSWELKETSALRLERMFLKEGGTVVGKVGKATGWGMTLRVGEMVLPLWQVVHSVGSSVVGYHTRHRNALGLPAVARKNCSAS
jgi:hypothetical protein